MRQRHSIRLRAHRIVTAPSCPRRRGPIRRQYRDRPADCIGHIDPHPSGDTATPFGLRAYGHLGTRVFAPSLTSKRLTVLLSGLATAAASRPAQRPEAVSSSARKPRRTLRRHHAASVCTQTAAPAANPAATRDMIFVRTFHPIPNVSSVLTSANSDNGITVLRVKTNTSGPISKCTDPGIRAFCGKSPFSPVERMPDDLPA